MMTEKGELALNLIKEKCLDTQFSAAELSKITGQTIVAQTLNSIVKAGFLVKVGDNPSRYTLKEGVESTVVTTTRNNSRNAVRVNSIKALKKLRNDMVSAIAEAENYMNNDTYADKPGSQVGIYIITYKNDNKYIYIGKTERPFSERWEEHKRNLMNGTHHCVKLQEKFDEEGADMSLWSFSILQNVEKDAEKIDYRERYWIQKYNKDDNYILLNTMKPSLHIGG